VEQHKSEVLETIIRQLLVCIGEDPDRPGLLETPARVARAWGTWAGGYGIDPASQLKTFADGAKEGKGELVIVHNIPVQSNCEHHMAPFHGIAHVGYIPAGKIVGLSKLARVVDAFSRRLQVQERLTQQIADCIDDTLKPHGTAVIIRATHTCMSSRGVKVHGSTTTTSAMRGALMDEAAARAEFMQLCFAAEKERG
jgi:GTP cyclohydrolase I